MDRPPGRSLRHEIQNGENSEIQARGAQGIQKEHGPERDQLVVLEVQLVANAVEKARLMFIGAEISVAHALSANAHVGND